MNCDQLEAGIIDRARGVSLEPAAAAAVDRHLHACEACFRLFDRERMLSASLRRLAETDDRMAPASSVDAVVMAAFDAAWQTGVVHVRRRPGRRFGFVMMAAIAIVLTTIGLWWGATGRRPVYRGLMAGRHIVVQPASPDVAPRSASAKRGVEPAREVRAARSRPAGRPRPTPPFSTEFVMWPGALALPPLESGELVRIDLPVSILPSLGLRPPAAGVAAVTADVLVGQDGLARAFRLVP